MKFYPSDFAKTYPLDSVLQNAECEKVARNIMSILSRTGNAWRTITLEEYEEGRKKDHSMLTQEAINSEKPYFERVVKYTGSWQAAILFSPAWANLNNE